MGTLDNPINNVHAYIFIGENFAWYLYLCLSEDIVTHFKASRKEPTHRLILVEAKKTKTKKKNKGNKPYHIGGCANPSIIKLSLIN